MAEDTSQLGKRLESIATRWTLVRRAHAGSGASSGEARNALVLRYASAIRGFLGAMARDDELADEIAQDVVVRLLKGDFAGADPDRGRFRDLLKTALRNMARNWWSRQKRRAAADLDLDLLEDESVEDAEDTWLTAWRSTILDVTWSALREYEQTQAGSMAYTVLHLRVEHPDDTSEQLAQRLSEQLGRTVRADAARQQLRRARVRFADLLVEEVADGLDQPTVARIEDELIALGLYEHLRHILPPDWRVGREGDDSADE